MSVELSHHNGEDITLRNISKSYGNSDVIDKLNITFKSGEFNVILGPSGCGKSTTMNMIAGLEGVTSGEIYIGQTDITHLEPKDRGCAMVFQNYALYPHMTVFDNIAYSLKIRRVPKHEIKKRVEAVAKMVSLTDYLDRLPSELSGGQRQRVAIGRAIVREPKVMLFDEPLSNLDAKLRHEMRMELTMLHNRLGATSIFVTHDQVEAMTLADKILILNQGKVEQFDTPKNIYQKPASTFVADFIGSPAMNLFAVHKVDGWYFDKAGNEVTKGHDLERAVLGVRPEGIAINPEGRIKGKLKYIEDMGAYQVLTLDVGHDQDFRINTTLGLELNVGEKVSFDILEENCHLFHPDTGRRIGE
ncbi:sn-glycerol-3-phosphate ABC transporter ATP-binding protein UgpC [Photobacterium rosenbergii]|uniref:sn-glycerol-3-phosphate ABC transporter ATP-binding protein UgpC n=1 Tax=Photobacterium rosenbergii TaxID=294936 RepID=A0A2T3NMI5_9GAMM|nr:sn-glycerol-3-phosphate ABC transporter ATP-binding protein UgpC [Photobacterium rosenbergii]PSW16711.1 sn-glycerol-3-phosphate ABC transporter ATP-binding protein UgpC [Photobacterium rosenbergii]